MKRSERIKRQRKAVEDAKRYHVILLRAGDQGTSGNILTADCLRELAVTEEGIKFDEELQALVYTGEATNPIDLITAGLQNGSLSVEPEWLVIDGETPRLISASICPVVRINEKK